MTDADTSGSVISGRFYEDDIIKLYGIIKEFLEDKENQENDREEQ